MIIELTKPPMYYNLVRILDSDQVPKEYRRLRKTISHIAFLKHADTTLPPIQIIVMNEDFLHVEQFVDTFDMLACQGYIDDVTDMSNIKLFIMHFPHCGQDDRDLYLNLEILSKQSLREFVRFFHRLEKYTNRGLILNQDHKIAMIRLFCMILQDDISGDFLYVLNNIMIGKKLGSSFIQVNVKAHGAVYEIRDPTNALLEPINIFRPCQDIYTDENLACYDFVDDENRIIDSGIVIIYNGIRTCYVFLDFDKAINRFVPCTEALYINDGYTFTLNSYDGNPVLVTIPLANGLVTVPARQLDSCLMTYGKVKTIQIDTETYCEYPKTMSYKIIIGEDTSYVSANHCQEGSNKVVHLCRFVYIEGINTFRRRNNEEEKDEDEQDEDGYQ